jgi:glutamate dehydrogenase
MTVAAESPAPISHTLKDISGYIENAFPGKQAQMVQVTEYLAEKAFIPAALAENEVSWFYG